MSPAIQCIFLLACMVTSATSYGCLCVKTSKTVKPSLIVEVKEYGLRPYCSKKEVIVVLKDNSSRCLDPNRKFTKAVLQTKQMQETVLFEKMNAVRAKTATDSSSATSATVSPSTTVPLLRSR